MEVNPAGICLSKRKLRAVSLFVSGTYDWAFLGQSNLSLGVSVLRLSKDRTLCPVCLCGICSGLGWYCSRLDWHWSCCVLTCARWRYKPLGLCSYYNLGFKSYKSEVVTLCIYKQNAMIYKSFWLLFIWILSPDWWTSLFCFYFFVNTHSFWMWWLQHVIIKLVQEQQRTGKVVNTCLEHQQVNRLTGNRLECHYWVWKRHSWKAHLFTSNDATRFPALWQTVWANISTVRVLET